MSKTEVDKKEENQVSTRGFIELAIVISYFVLIWYIHIYALRLYQSDPRSIYQMACDDHLWFEKFIGECEKQIYLYLQKSDFMINGTMYGLVFISAGIVWIATLELFEFIRGKIK